MPNWSEGKLKIRGKKEDILLFFKNGTSLIDHKDGEMIEIIPDVEIDDDFNDLFIKNLGKRESLYIKETSRHFLKPDFSHIELYNIDENGELSSKQLAKEYIIVINFIAAWEIEVKILSEISKKYNIDFKIYAFESGLEFNQDIEIVKGNIIKNEKITFKNYIWECIDPTIGG